MEKEGAMTKQAKEKTKKSNPGSTFYTGVS